MIFRAKAISGHLNMPAVSGINEFDKAMIDLVSHMNLTDFSYIRTDEEHKIISYIRDDKLFVYNFSHNSYTDCRVASPCRDYRIVLSTDEAKFGGFDRIDTKMTYRGNQGKDTGYVSLYLPARTALVLEPDYRNLATSPWSEV